MLKTKQPETISRAATEGLLLSRPAKGTPATNGAAPSGQHRLEINGNRDTFLYVPHSYSANRAAPLAVMLHGAGGNGQQGLRLLQQFADKHGIFLLAPKSRRATWDVIAGQYGPDVTVIDLALEHVFSRYNIDPARLAVGGFSDGASYALSLGITNGDLFSHVIAFSPGFIAPAAQQGSPRLFISHGTDDKVLPIHVCSRKIVPQVQRAGYNVTYKEFEGPHTVPSEIAREAAGWFLKLHQ